VTKDAGNAVYVAAYSPYGKIQEEWVPTYQPSLKFSGKERETNSEVDYFGARYYNHKHYRFLSVDPVINREEALSNPQLWNLYAFCRNNPVTFLDPTGEYGIDVHYYMTYYLAKQAGFSERDAIMISRANQFIDENPSTDSTRIRIKNLKQTMEMWHFASEQRVAEVLSNAYESGDLNMLGTALHVLQDSLYAHKGYKAPFGHVVDTLLGRNPDETFRDVEKALEMAQQTLNVLTRFRGVESKKIDKGFLRNYFKTREIEDKIDMIK
jgi:RHS repeat-associated protein